MADDSIYIVFILVVSMVVRIESIAGCQDENNLKTLHETTDVGSSVELACNVTYVQFASWMREDQGLTLGTTVYEKWRHFYSLRRASITNISNYSVYNLVVQNVTEDVEGVYKCQEQGCPKTRVNLTVEVPPVLWLETEHSNISKVINVTLNQEMDIRCKAVGGKPTVSLSWEINGEDETDGVTSVTEPNEVLSILNYRPNIDDQMVTCKTSGQIAVPSMRASVNINVLYPPTCHTLVHNDSSATYKVTCVCVANPEVSSSVIFVNNFPYKKDNHVSLPVTLSAEIYCRAENGVGVYKSPVFTHTPEVSSTTLLPETQTTGTKSDSQIALMTIVALLVVVIVIIGGLAIGVSLYKRSPSLVSTYSTWDQSAGFRTLSSRPPCPSPMVTHRITSIVDDNYAYVPSHEVVVKNGTSHEKPNVTLDAVGEGDAYNLQYFEIPRQSNVNAENVNVAADSKEDEMNEMSNEKPNVTLDAVGQGDAYNSQYFEIPRQSNVNAGNAYAAADSNEDETQEHGGDKGSGSSCASSFSDEQYFRSSMNWDIDTSQEPEVPISSNIDPYEWTEPNTGDMYEWAKPNKGKHKY